MSDETEKIDVMKPPDGWVTKKTPLGYAFQLLYGFKKNENAETAHHIVEVRWFPSSGEAQVVGPGRLSKKGASTGPLDLNAVVFAHTELPVILLWLARVAKG